MCSIRKSCGRMLAMLAASAVVGCQTVVPAPIERVNDTPLVVDDAMQMREWDESVVQYANGDTVAGGNGYMFRTHETMPPLAVRAVEPAMATTNMLLLPVGVFVNSPFKKQVYQGAVVPPTYTAVPPIGP
jgi:hypothetical protein